MTTSIRSTFSRQQLSTLFPTNTKGNLPVQLVVNAQPVEHRRHFDSELVLVLQLSPTHQSYGELEVDRRLEVGRQQPHELAHLPVRLHHQPAVVPLLLLALYPSRLALAPTQRLHQPIHLRSLVRRRREAHRHLYASLSSHASTERLRGAVLAPLACEAVSVVRLHVRKTQVELPTLHHRQHVLLPFRNHHHP